jgi:multidrug efflux pump subunit AcrA (membrane-fusion protein)
MRRAALNSLITLIVLLNAGYGTLAGETKVASAAENGAEARPVTVTKPSRRDINRWIKLPASVEADAEVTLYAKVSGVLKDFNVDVGDRVKPGQLIGKLDAPELEQDVKYQEAQLAASQGEYQKAQAELERVQLRGDEIDAKQKILEAELLKVKADDNRIHKQYDRTAKLFANNAATELEKDFQEDTCAEQDAVVKECQGKIGALKPDRDVWAKELVTGKASVEAARGRVGIAQAALDRARVWLAYTEIRVPQIGTHVGATAVIGKRYVNNGDLIAGAQDRAVVFSRWCFWRWRIPSE